MSDPTERIDRPEPSEARTAAESLLGEGKTLGDRYRVQKLLGRGGMGEVWQAFDLKLRVEVALKTIHAYLFPGEQGLEMLRREVLAARAVVSPNVCRIFDLVEVEGQELVSMEYVDGTTLLDLFKERGGLEIQEAAEIASQFLAGLEAIHEAGLVHRDLKPENLMVTRSGRVLVMDFGIAKDAAGQATGTVSGTPAYMAPEQARGDAVDARTDVFAAGVVLAELMSGDAASDSSSRQTIWKKVHHDPPQAPEGPWSQVITKAVAKGPDDRYESAGALARALEEATLRTAGADDVTPYPGLATFKETDAEYFFGREAEVEAIWRKLEVPRLQALIGPSGAGKSSFLRAGLVASMPDGWRAIVCHPGDRPLRALGRALADELAGDAEAQRDLVDFHEPDVAVELLSRWRRGHQQTLLIVDQFEELFTLNPAEVQASFSDLLGRVAVEADVHVLLSMRDDFFFRCHEHKPLAPILSELTLIGPPEGTDLRRAMVQPALKCGYRFEDEDLVDEMLAEVEGERGALPLLAFAAASLWERRDRDHGSLTRDAYEAIGGVGGALARHAEATLELIGKQRQAVVREIFRNLVTAEGTRASRDREQLLSVFDDRQSAESVLHQLVDARLLTSYEVPRDETEESEGGHRIEIVHESLLSAWPRVVRWRTQDADGAQLRDQLRQAAQAWRERGHLDELLWTGAAFREFLVWRENYSGGLTASEGAFAEAMVEQAERQKRRRRLAVSAVVFALVTVVIVIGLLWWESEAARLEAVEQTARSEAARLLVLGRLQEEASPSAALAYALASLELADTPDARRLALSARSRGPSALVVPVGTWAPQFSPDGKWLARAGWPADVDRSGVPSSLELWPRDGGSPTRLEGHAGLVLWPEFSVDGARLVSSGLDGTVRVWSVPDGKLLSSLDVGGPSQAEFRPDGEIVIITAIGPRAEVRRWAPDAAEAEIVGEVTSPDTLERLAADVDAANLRFALGRGSELELYDIGDMAAGPRVLGRHDSTITRMRFTSDTRSLFVLDESGAVRLWSLVDGTWTSLSALGVSKERTQNVFIPSFSTDDRWLSIPANQGETLLKDLSQSNEASPTSLRLETVFNYTIGAFDPTGQWLATASPSLLALWPIDRHQPIVLEGGSDEGFSLVFAADGESLFVAAQGGVHEWPLWMAEPRREVLSARTPQDLSLHPDGQSLLVTDQGGRVWQVSLGDRHARPLEGFTSSLTTGAFSPSGRLAAAAGGFVAREDAVVRVWDLESGDAQVLDPGDGEPIREIVFASEQEVISSSGGGVLLWDLEIGESTVLLDEPRGRIALSPDGGTLLLTQWDDQKPVLLLDIRSGRIRELSNHGTGVTEAVFDPSGELVITGSQDGIVRVGRVDGGEVHELMGHEIGIVEVAIHPNGEWIASIDESGSTRVWPMPKGQPFYSLPYDELLEKLRALTNYRVVPDEASDTGYKLEIGPFPGWETVTSW